MYGFFGQRDSVALGFLSCRAGLASVSRGKPRAMQWVASRLTHVGRPSRPSTRPCNWPIAWWSSAADLLRCEPGASVVNAAPSSASLHDVSQAAKGKPDECVPEKIAVAIDKDLRLAREARPTDSASGNRGGVRAVQETIAEKLERMQKARLAHECEKLDPGFERELAELGLAEDAKRWPKY
jgi:hypothetical protein